eukprot:Lankesteria_metandrocarpae@DN4976_c0_g2_i1.p1
MVSARGKKATTTKSSTTKSSTTGTKSKPEQMKRPGIAGEETKRRKKPNFKKLDRFIFKLLKTVEPSFGISTKGMEIVNSFVFDILDRLVGESSSLMKKTSKTTLKYRDANSAALLVLPGDLAKMGIAEGQRALQQYSEHLS